MYRHRLIFPAILGLLACVLPASAQQTPLGLPLGRLDIVSPCGTKGGTSVEVLLTGADLDDPTALVFSHPGIKAELLKDEEPKPDPKDPKKMAAPPKKGAAPGVAAGRFKVTVAPDVPVGQYDVRLVHKWGTTNPRFFCIGDLPEVAEKEPNNDVGEAQRVDINTTINGTIATPTDVDFSVFTGKKGQRVIFNCLTSSIDSKARPMIELFDPTGKRIAFNRNYNGNDALADAILPEDGDYFLRLSEFTYTAGSAQHYYRLSITTAPWIDALYPPMVEPGKPAQVTLYGRNLPGGTLEPGSLVDGRPVEKVTVTINPPKDGESLAFNSRLDPKSGGIDGFEYRIKGPGGMSNPVLIGFATAKVVVEKEGNDKAETAEELPIPCEVAGRIDKRQDRDWFAVNVKKGDVLAVELFSDRLGVPADLYLAIKKDKAMTEVEEDDNPDIMQIQQFYNRTSDPKTHRLVAAEDGKYLIAVGSRESNFSFGPRVTYRLRVTSEKPDFRLVAMPSTTSLPDTTILRQGGFQYLDVFAFRNDGFNGPITLTAEGLPAGVTCPATVIGTGAKQGTLVFEVADNAAPFDGAFRVKGTAEIVGKPVVRQARSATITWAVQQNIPAIARMDQGPFLSIRDKAQFKVTLDMANAFLKKGEKLEQPLMLKPNDKLTVPFKVTRVGETKTPITLQQIVITGVNPQQGPVAINNGAALPAIAPDKNDGEFVVEVRPTAPPGVYTLALKATTPIQYANPTNKKTGPVQVIAATNPIVIKVIPTSVAKVTATPKKNFKTGADGELTVKVERQGDYAGEFKIKVALPPNTKGVTIADFTIPAGKDEVTVPVKVADDAAAGTLQNVVLTATAMYEGKVPLSHEVKFPIVIEKTVKDKK